MLANQSHLFALDEGVTYLNCAYMSPALNAGEEAAIAGIKLKRHPWKLGVSNFFDPRTELAKAFAQLIGASDYERVALIPSVSYGMAAVARNVQLKAGQQIVGVAGQFPSNVYCWKRLADSAGGTLTLVAGENAANWNATILAAITPATAVVAVPHVHWADGTLFDLEAIGRKAREVGALLIIDGTQSVGALAFDLQAIKPDAVVCAGYKWLLGGYGLGLAWYGPAFDGGTPIEENWITRLDSDKFAGLVDYEDSYRAKAWRYNMGELSNFVLIPALHEGISQILRWGVHEIQQWCSHISEEAIQTLVEAGFQLPAANEAGRHLFGIRPPAGVDTANIKAQLDQQGIVVSQRGDALRISPHLYNSQADMNRLAEACIKSLK